MALKGNEKNPAQTGEPSGMRAPSANAAHAPAQADNFFAAAPALSLPKGGGAIRGLGEKFAANPVTGTGSMTVPIAVSPGRSGFAPQLALSYDSGAGNGPFGLGWNLSLPAITRKTDKGLPQYNDAEESDVFILSGAEDLVPAFKADAAGKLLLVQGQPVLDEEPRIIAGTEFRVRRYRPRTEGLFARIERWTNIATGELHWRSITRDNITTLYGKDNYSRIFDPAELDKAAPDDLSKAQPVRIFSWLICASYDDKGNAIIYEYAPENAQQLDLTQANERNRQRAANRYPKRIRYGNRLPNRDADWQPTEPQALPQATWMFEVVFDYGEHDAHNPKPSDTSEWRPRPDAFSTYRSGFEVRTQRLCQRVLLFHHIAEETGVGKDCLVRSTDFTYTANHITSFLSAVTQSGYKRDGDGYLKRSLPPVEFTYSQAVIQDKVEELDEASLANLPYGFAGADYQWVDLDGEGLAGLLTEQAGAWFYKRNLSPINHPDKEQPQYVRAKFAPVELVAAKPNAALTGGQAQFMDLAGDGQLDLVLLDGPAPGFYEHDEVDGWQPFRPFTSRLNLETRDPNLKFVDLNGDGHADLLITENEAFTWHPSLAEEGFGPAQRTLQSHDEEKGPKLVFADGAQSIYLADFSGDGLTDLVRIRNGEVCYWPNLGYGKFGAKVTMDNAPHFDRPEQFDQQRIRLADIDGSGVTDIIYLHSAGVRLYFNQSGNSWSAAQQLNVFPQTDNLSAVIATDLLGNGTACLVWSSPLPGAAQRQMRYVDLMGGEKPHLLVKTVNNLGAETTVQYALSTKFYLQDKYEGEPWITRLPFPVHVVERVETFDHISRNRFVTRYEYHHGYFDGVEREFRGFGMVEQWDTDEFNKLDPTAANVDASWHVPPVHTRTWFHTGAYLRGQELSRQLAHEYFSAPKDKDEFEKWLNETLLPDTVFPEVTLSAEEERQAVRALKGMMLRQEVYADDGSAKAGIPYTVTEQNFTIAQVQPQAGNRHAVFFAHPREAISYHYERNTADPRVTHAMTLEVDAYGNVQRSVAIGYRRNPGPGVSEPEQQQTHITLTANRFANKPREADWYRLGLPVEALTFEVVKAPEPQISANRVRPFSFAEMRALMTSSFPLNQSEPEAAQLWPYEKWDWRTNAANAPPNMRLRLIERVRTLYRKDDLTALAALGEVEALALPGESYKLALTPALLAQVYQRQQAGQPIENLLPAPAGILQGKGADEGGYVLLDGNWWIPSGRVFFSHEETHTAAQELAFAQAHFFLPQRFRDPFGHDTLVSYDAQNLLVTQTTDVLSNTSMAVNDYRVLQPWLLIDPNQNRTAAAFDALGMVVATAVQGKAGQNVGDLLEDFAADPPLPAVQGFSANPRQQAAAMLGKATTRIVYDLDRFHRCGQPPFAATLARETHFHDSGGATTKIQISFSYSDGFGREIQKKIQAEEGDAPQRQPNVPLPATNDIRPGALVKVNGQVVQANAPQRWVGTGRTVFNNKGKPVRQYEPFFSATHLYEEEREMTDTGVSPVLFYDPVERVIATLHPNHTYEKVVFDPWQQTTWDVNDTVTFDPRNDSDIAGYVKPYFDTESASWETWHAQRIGNQMGAAERDAAQKAANHANTPTIAHLDTLGRTFLTLAHNGFAPDTTPILFATRVVLDIEGNQRAVIDAKRDPNIPGDLGRIVMRYDYDLLGTRIHQASMEAGERWLMNDATGKPIRTWDSRRFVRRMTYDELRRPVGLFVTENGAERLAEQTIYGESQGDAANHRTRVHQIKDGAGVVTSEAYDFKGNLLRSRRELLPDYKQAVNWLLNPVPNDGTFTTSTTYDALNRPLSVTTPDNSVYRPTFNEANLLDKVEVNLRGEQENGELKWTAFVRNINYNAKGQRTLIEYGCGVGANKVTTTYEYDALTFRLTNLQTTRPPGLNGAATLLFADPAIVQDLHYSYDPVGNITRIEDKALRRLNQTGPADNAPCEYTYDAVYRLIEATGREHIGQTTLAPPPPNGTRRDYPFFFVPVDPNDVQAMRRYTERYEYDEVGNFIILRHLADGGSWNRDYAYQAPSLLEAGKLNNRLTHSEARGFPENYSYDAHGNLTASNAMTMAWDFEDQLQRVDLGGGGTAYYVYDAGGQRVRKVLETQNGARKQERIYLGSFELYREFGANGTTVELKREALQVVDDNQRLAMVETRTQGNDGSPEQVQRYQLGNHLGSASMELDEGGALVSYEEYHPYGATAFQAGRSTAEVNLKRYRYTGQERDEETGFNHHGARYYAPWLGRWTSCDPAGLVDGPNVYAYARNSPVVRVDPQGTISWGKVLGIGAAILVGVAITALTAGALGPVGAGIVAGAIAGATGEIVEAAVDKRPITLSNVLVAAGVGAAFGGVFAGAGQIIARTGIGARVASRIASSAIGQAAARASYRVATSSSRSAGAARAVAGGARQGIEALERVGERAGRRLGGRFAENAERQAADRAALEAARQDAAARAGNSGVQASLQGELNEQPFSATTRSGVDRSGTGVRAIETPEGRVQAPGPEAVPDVLRPLPVPGANGQTFQRGADAEFKLFGHTLLSTNPNASGRLYLGVTAPICPSCSANLWNTRAALPGVRIITDLPSQTQGAAGALQLFLPDQRNDLPPPVPVLQIQGTF